MNKSQRLLISILFVSVFADAQGPYFSQYHNAALHTNPAFAGASGGGRAFLGYRNQWPKISSNYQTYCLGYDQYFKAIRGGVGINAYSDMAGKSIKTDRLELIYSAHIPLFNNKMVLKPAIAGGYSRKFIDYSALSWGNQYNPSTGTWGPISPPSELKSQGDFFDLSAGVLIYSKRVYGGVALKHINQPTMSFWGGEDKTYMKQTYHLGFILGSDSLKGFSLSPNALFEKQGPSHREVIGVTGKYTNFLLGINYQFQDALIFATGFQHRLFKLSYSYDYIVSDLSSATTVGAHELSLIFWLNYKKEPSSILALRPIAF